jgi:hypothetical protein
MSLRESLSANLAQVNILMPILLLALWVAPHTQGQEWLSGQDSPVHDSDRLTPVSGKVVSLENDDVRVAFDGVSGAFIAFTNKRTGWNIQKSPQLGESFRVFAPTPDRSYNPVLGARNQLASIQKSTDGRSLKLEWKSLHSEYRGVLDITLQGTVSLDGPDVAFEMKVDNHEGWTVTSVDWPIIGSLALPQSTESMSHLTRGYGTVNISPLWPRFEDERGYYGTNYPIQMGDGRFDLVLARGQGLYMGTHDTSQSESTRYTFELKPGFSDSFDQRVPDGQFIDGHPTRIVASLEHFPFVPSGASTKLSRIVLSPFSGDWHHGADIYRRWRATWFHPPVGPAWVEGVNSWEQIQIDSSEDDLRTPYRDLPRRASQAAKAGVSAIQLVGWNNGGQDRGNPSHDTDPRLGTWQDLHDAIGKIQAMGVHVILFNKYTWVDTTNPEYEAGLKDHVAKDPNGWPYVHPGYQYQTPEQLADINTRRLAVACIPDAFWQDLSAREFKKSIDLGASGILYDEVFHHANANYCFSHKDGQLVAQPIFQGDIMLGRRFHEIVRDTVGENNFLFAGELTYDLEQQYYTLSYFRILPGHVPLDRYDEPFMPMMIAVTGFDDREMISEALRYRYILSYEPFNFKGNLSDFPATLNYGEKMDTFRRKYQDYVWNAQFRDNQDATVTVSGKPYNDFSTFLRRDGKRAVVVVNPDSTDIFAAVALNRSSGNLQWASPEHQELHPFTKPVIVPGRSAVVVMEQ